MATGGSHRVSERARAAAEHGAVRIVQTLRDRGFVAYLAGGCVRDLLLGLRPADYDVATSATPDEVLSLFEDSHAVGKAFGVVLVRFGRGVLGEQGGHPSPAASVEVATFRREGVYSDSRRPDYVEFCGPEDDARRRDFTINALFLDPLDDGPLERRVIDTVGGLADLREGVIRAVGDPASRLREDHLRALRAVRFAARLGFEIEKGTAKAIADQATHLRGVSEERIGDELRRMLGENRPVPSRKKAIEMLEGLGLADAILGFAGHAEWKANEGPALGHLTSGTRFGAVLVAWLHDRLALAGESPENAASTLGDLGSPLRRALKLSNEETAVFRAAAEGLRLVEPGWGDASIAQRKRWASADWFEDCMILIAGRKPCSYREIRENLALLIEDGIGLAPEPWVSGDDLIASGLPPGPDFKNRLDRAYDAQLNGEARTRFEALQIALSGFSRGG